jgi:hypothetical protein
MGRNYLAQASGNAVLAAARYNFRRLLAWLGFRISIALGLAGQLKLV